MDTLVEDAKTDRAECWCCGMVGPPGAMVHLGNHPEVTLCLRCAHFVHKQAWEIEDRERDGPGVRARDGFRRLRRQVMARGLHQSRWVGGPLRWLGRHLP